MHLYYAHSIRWVHTIGERTAIEVISYLHSLWHTVSSEEFFTALDPNMNDKEIYSRDIEMLESSDLILVNVTNPSLGVWYEIGYAEARQKPIVCFYQATLVNYVSAMVTGNPAFTTYGLQNIEQLQEIICSFNQV
jgi:2'-deoxynucleoside 5'-phosphate N-hydrolase